MDTGVLLMLSSLFIVKINLFTVLELCLIAVVSLTESVIAGLVEVQKYRRIKPLFIYGKFFVIT